MLLIEVSNTSLKRGFKIKADLDSGRGIPERGIPEYGIPEYGIPEYWVIDILNRRFHEMTGIQNGRYRSIQLIKPPSPLSPTCHADAVRTTAELFDVTSRKSQRLLPEPAETFCKFRHLKNQSSPPTALLVLLAAAARAFGIAADSPRTLSSACQASLWILVVHLPHHLEQSRVLLL